MKLKAGLVVTVAFLALGVKAQAQSCLAQVNDMRAHYPTYYTRVFVTSSQANKVSSSAARALNNLLTSGALLSWDGAQMTTLGVAGTGELQFNDRLNPGQAPNTSQSFSVTPSQRDNFSLSISADGTVVKIIDNRWGSTLTINNPTCSNGIMFGFGTPIGNTNGGNLAMYVFSFTYLPAQG